METEIEKLKRERDYFENAFMEVNRKYGLALVKLDRLEDVVETYNKAYELARDAARSIK